MNAAAETLARELARRAAVSIGAPVSEVVHRHKSLAWILGRLRQRLPGVPDLELRQAVQDLPNATFEVQPEAPAAVGNECPWCGEDTGGVFCDTTCRHEFDASPSGGETCPWCGVATDCGGFCSPACLTRATPARGQEPGVSGQWRTRGEAIAAMLVGLAYPVATHAVLRRAKAELRWTTHMSQSALASAEQLKLVAYSGRYWFAIGAGGLNG